jgi:hypothetical protein
MTRLSGLFLALLITSSAFAGLEPRFATTFLSPDGKASTNWRVRLVSGALEPGMPFSQHITIYDIPNLIAGESRQPAGWVASFQMLGVNAAEIALSTTQDSPTLMNVTWTWTGKKRIPAPAELDIFGITQFSASGTQLRRLFVGQTSRAEFETGPVALIGYVRGTLTAMASLKPRDQNTPILWANTPRRVTLPGVGIIAR